MTTPDSPRIPVIGYIRVSTWREEKISPEIQIEAITTAAARKGRYIIGWIKDLDESGRHFKRKIMQCIEAVEEGTYSEIWVWKFSRFGRSRHGVAINLARVERVGGQLISATEDVDATTATGRFARGMLFEVAAFESDRAGEQWKETHARRRSLGLPATGRPRFGYRWYPRRIPTGDGSWTLQEERYEVIPDQAEAALTAYQQYTAGKTGYGKIAHYWNDLGLLNSWGNPWQDQGVRDYLDAGFGAGLLHVHKQDVRCGDTSHCRAPDHWHYRGAEHEAIITGDEWDAYQERRIARKNTPRRSLNPVYPLSGLMECGVCRADGRKSHAQITGYKNGSLGVAYRCGANARGHVTHGPVRADRTAIDLEVYGWLLRVRDEIDAIATGRIVLPQPHMAPDTTMKRKKLKAQIADLSASLDRATEGNVTGRIPDDTYERTRDKLTRDRDQVQKALDALPKPEDPQQQGPMPHRETITGLIEEWDTISVPSKRVALAAVIRRVEVGLDKGIEVIPVWAPDDPPTVNLKRKAT